MSVWVGYFEIPARDLNRASEFYQLAFGWDVETVEWTGPPYLKIRVNAVNNNSGSNNRTGIEGGLMAAKHAGFESPLLVLHVGGEGLGECLERIVEAGGTVEVGPTRLGDDACFARFRDSEGNLLGLWKATTKPTAKN